MDCNFCMHDFGWENMMGKQYPTMPFNMPPNNGMPCMGCKMDHAHMFPGMWGGHMNNGSFGMNDMFMPQLPNMYGVGCMNEMKDDMFDVESTMMDDKNIKTDPPPIISDNPETVKATLFKQLTGYPNYGNPSGNADILYTGNRGVWNFNRTQALMLIPSATHTLIIRAVLDDHKEVPVDRYSANIIVNGVQVHTGRLPLQHGVPAKSKFNNWKELEFKVPRISANTRVVIVNTSKTSPKDWIGLDWMEIRVG